MRLTGASIRSLPVVAWLALACGPAALPAAPTGVAPKGFGGAGGEAASGDQCVVPRGDTEPFVVEWDAAKRNKVKQLSTDGVLLAVHSGCGLAFLDGCAVGGGYDDVKAGGDRIADSFDIGSATQLRSRLPIGYFELYGRFRKDDRWTLEYVFADSRKARAGEVRRSELPPRCAEATHYVSRIMLGAYRLRSAAALGGGAGAGARGAGVAAESESGAEIIRQGGAFERCRDQATPGGDGSCQAIVQIYLREITDDVPPPAGAARPSSRGEATPVREGAPEGSWTPAPAVLADWGWVTVHAGREGAAVLIDGIEVGATPLVEHRMKAGRHEVELRHECLLPIRREVIVTAGETAEVRLEPAGREGALAVLPVTANGKPVRADVYLDGRRLGTTSGKLTADVYRVSICDTGKRLEVKAPGFATFERAVGIAERETTAVEADLAPPGEAAGGGARGDEVLQPGTELHWLRCPVGQTWSGSACVGIAARMGWSAAKGACPAGYRLPARQEIVELLGGCDDDVGSGKSGHCRKCADGEACRSLFPADAGRYWAASPLDDDRAWRASFHDGRLVVWYLVDDQYSVRCLRAEP